MPDNINATICALYGWCPIELENLEPQVILALVPYEQHWIFGSSAKLVFAVSAFLIGISALCVNEEGF